MDNHFFRSLNYVRCGNADGETIIFLHAAGLNLTWWDQQFRVLSTQFNLLAMDLPGHGRSGRQHDKCTLENLAESVADTLKNIVAGPVHIVGLSVGGMIAQLLALRYPELVKSLFLVATQCTLSDDVREVMRRRAFMARSEGMKRLAKETCTRWLPASFIAQRPDVAERVINTLLSNDAENFASIWDAISALNLENSLPAIRCRTLVMSGEQDNNAPVAAGMLIASLIPDARFVSVPGAGHLLPSEKPDIFNQTLCEFIGR